MTDWTERCGACGGRRFRVETFDDGSWRTSPCEKCDVCGVRSPMSELFDAILRGDVEPWAAEWARDGDPLPKLWAEGESGEGMGRIMAALGYVIVADGREVHPAHAPARVLRELWPTLTLDRVRAMMRGER